MVNALGEERLGSSKQPLRDSQQSFPANYPPIHTFLERKKQHVHFCCIMFGGRRPQRVN